MAENSPISENSEKVDYAKWPTKQQAAAAIRCSTKTIEQLAKDGKLQQATWRRLQGPALVVYHPDDVLRIAKERNPAAAPFVLPADHEPANGNGHAALALAAAPASDPDAFALLLAALRQLGVGEGSQKLLSEASEKQFMKVPEASRWSGLPQACIRRLIDEGKLEVVKDGRRVYINRLALEQLGVRA